MPNPDRPQISSARAKRGVVLLALIVLATLTIAGPAAAVKSCGKKVVDDWYADGRVDGTYPAHCYDDAIEILPRDVRDYSSAKEDIERALQASLRGEPAPPATTDPTPGAGPGSAPTDPEPTDPEPTEPEPTDPEPTDPEPTDSGPTDTTPAPAPGTDPNEPGNPEAGPAIDTASADSVPIPLLVLAGLALLLVAAGSAGYLARRIQARRVPPPTA
ncbi:MAG TPA: hypothetical protein VNI55_12270 [Gaiellaceae bacterium]|nr:hypothetical protein [Gaiellaceae bacterium]